MRVLFSILFALIINQSHAQLYPVPVYAVTSTQVAQGGEDVSNAIDGDINTIYHSKWYQEGIPDTLDFYFNAQAQSIKEIIYTPRQNGGNNGIWTNIDVFYATHSQPENFITLAENIDWEANYELKTIELSNEIDDVFIVRFAVNAGVENFSSCAEMEFFSEDEYEETQAGCVIPTEDLNISGINDIKVEVLENGSFASSYQGGENIEKSFDGDINTIYHSPWSNTVFPVTLNYAFDGETPMDYLKYTPRLDGSLNGHFGNVNILYNTLENDDFQSLISYNFDYSSVPTIVEFPTSITPKNIQFIVEHGMNNFASCAEMEFYKKGIDESNDIPSGIFADALCTELEPSITQAQINNISSLFYKELAQCLFDETYDLNYRKQSFEVYHPVQKVHQGLKVWGYNQYENPTGILFTEGEKIVVFVEDMPAVGSISIRLKNFVEGYDGANSFYPLKNGLNVFEAQNDGLAYISYFNNDINLSDIQIHFASGRINGLFKKGISNDIEWISLLDNNQYPMLDIVGEFTHLVYHKDALKSGSPLSGQALIDKYDEIVRHQRQMMGWFKYDVNPKNRQLSLSDIGGGWYAGGAGIHLDLTWGVPGVTNPNQLDLWGIPHEFGHLNQIQKDISWIGTTEVTNNVYAVWTYYKMNPEGRKYTRLEYEYLKPAPDMPTEIGGRINSAIKNTHIDGKHVQNNDPYNDVFKTLVPFWQLELYYQIAGACKDAPELTFDYPADYEGVDYAHWYGTVAEVSRNTNSAGLTNGDYLLNFVKNTCDAVEEDLTDFFTNSGFLKPIDIEIDDYGVGQLTVTQTQIDETIAYIKSKNYEEPISPVINYMSAHSVEIYKNKQALTGVTGVGVNVLNNALEIENSEWENAVAFETYNDDNELMHVSIRGTGDLSLETTRIYYPENAHKVFAVGYDGERILVYPESELEIIEFSKEGFSIYPNPLSNNDYLTIKADNKQEEVEVALQTVLGQYIIQTNGSIEKIQKAVNDALNSHSAGSFILSIKRKGNRTDKFKIIKK